MEGIIWLGILILMVIIEIITLGLTTIWFAGGALVAFVASFLETDILLQITLFIITSFVLLFCTRPIALKAFNRGRAKTNADSLIGAVGIVTAGIDNLQSMGTVQVKGQEWSARSVDDALIASGRKVQIEKISGVKLMVREIHHPKESN